MAKNAIELNRKVLQNLRTSGSNEYIESILSGSAAMGEIIVQMAEPASGTSLWTLAKDGETAVQFVNKETVEDMIAHGAVDEVKKIEESVGLDSDGSYIEKSGTNYLDSATTVEEEIGILDTQLGTLSGYVADSDYSLVKDDNKVVVGLNQEDGRISGESDLLTSLKLSGYTVGGDDSGKLAETDTLGQALGKLQGQINGMDKAADAETGKIVTTVSEEDGKVSETKAYLKDIVLSGYTKTNDTGDIDDVDTVEVALSKLENQIGLNTITNADGSINVTTGANSTDINVNIKSGEHVLAKDGDAGVYTDIEISAVTPSSEIVKEEYILKATDGTQLGESIKIYKDSHIVSIDYITDSGDTHYQNLEYVYIDASGETQTTYIDISQLVLEAEFASGVTITDHIAHGVVDPQSEEFLTVGAEGFKLSGVQNAIDLAKEQAISAATIMVADEEERATSAETKLRYDLDTLSTAVYAELDEIVTSVETLSAATIEADADLQRQINELSGGTSSDIAELSAATVDEIARAMSAETALDAVIGSVKDANDETRSYTHSGTNYLDNNETVKDDVETLDELLGKSDIGTSAETVFDSTNTVAKSISDIKKALDAFEHQSELTVVDDGQYIDAQVTTAETGTTIGVSAITMDITASTSSDSALADSYDVRHFAVNDIVADDTRIEIIEDTAVGNTEEVRKIDFSLISIDCGEF